MPSQTYFNLPKEKQERIMDAIISEMGVHDYDAFNIASVIRQSKIPRGSFYQYFVDKDDLFDYFYAYVAPTELSAHGDTIVLPDQYASVVTARTRYYVHQFKESLQQAAFALDDYKKGMKRMKSNLINPQPKNMTDDRVYF